MVFRQLLQELSAGFVVGVELLLVAAGTTLGHEKLLLFDRHRSLRVLAFLAKNVFLNKSNKIWLSIAALL